MDVEWDERKARTNLEKHGIDFADAVAGLEDPCALGLDGLGRLLVVYTVRDERIRLISARRANRREQRQYEDGL